MDVTAMCDKLTKLHLAGKSSLCLEKPNTEYVIHLDSQSCSKSNTSALLAASSSNLNVRLYSRNSLVYSRTLSGYTEINNRLSSLDVSCDGNFICAGTDVLKEDAYLIFW
ncbi:hypothetical protein LSH36_250g03049 [Paralvinella palmiformis]|uniref:Uncharacterized protein n=1 Tax=Paralvinella palmiformis TaxID=53620 RepID=A0AAD9JN44_9ANNE|nr:hypothetical protein LSH36_250g03049 [Paralvinella palmiformis]